MPALSQDRCKEDVRVELKALVEQCRTALRNHGEETDQGRWSLRLVVHSFAPEPSFPASTPDLTTLRSTSKITAGDQPNMSTPFTAGMGPSSPQRSTGVTSP